MGFGDFARYTIGTNSNKYSEFLVSRLNEPRAQSAEDIYVDWLEHLPDDAQRTVSEYVESTKALRMSLALRKLHASIASADVEFAGLNGEMTEEDELPDLPAAVDAGSGGQILDSYLSANRPEEPERLPLSLIQRYVVSRVLQLGWTVEAFGEFDARQQMHRGGGHQERIGKKYQWIALHEAFGRLARCFHFQDRFDSECREFCGAWQLGYRDIDPSLILCQDAEPAVTGCPWWIPNAEESRGHVLRETASLKRWLGDPAEVSDPAAFIVTVDPEGFEWCNLSGYFDIPPEIPDELTSGDRKPNLWYTLRAYFIKNADASTFQNWAVNQDYMGRWMPEPFETHGVFFGEYFSRLAYQCGRRDYQTWIRPSEELPIQVMTATEDYHWTARDPDCSLKDSVNMNLPCKDAVECLALKRGPVDGEWVGPDGCVVARHVEGRVFGPSGFLMRVDALRGYLERRGLQIVWTVLGERQVTGEIGGVIEGCPRAEYGGAYWLESDGLKGQTTARIKTGNEAETITVPLRPEGGVLRRKEEEREQLKATHVQPA